MQSHVHYSPSSAGALMDPVFLRHAVQDAESGVEHDAAEPGHRSATPALSAWREVGARWARWRRSAGRPRDTPTD